VKEERGKCEERGEREREDEKLIGRKRKGQIKRSGG
jgi:hypothetical protein